MTAGIDRRRVLIGGGAGLGLVVAWGLWPRAYAPNLVASPGEQVFGAWLKIGTDGHVTVAVPQAEHGQGAYTVIAQIVADELGADWRTVGVEPAPVNPLYANPLALDDLFDGMFAALPAAMHASWAARADLMLTGGSTSVRMFEEAAREAGAAARALLCRAAANRWDVDIAACRVEAGFVVAGRDRLRFADLVEAAAKGRVPDPLPIGDAGAGTLMGQSLDRLDSPAKVDGSANFAGDMRLPDMVHAAIRQAPPGDARLVHVDRAAAQRIRGVVDVVEGDGWVAVAATTWWAAQRGLDALALRYETNGGAVDSASIAAALATALNGDGVRMAETGDARTILSGPGLVTAEYQADAAVHAALETPSATAALQGDRLQLWMPTQAPALAHAAAARAAGLDAAQVTIHPMLIGGSFGAALEPDVAAQAATLAVKLHRPVCLVWSRGEALLHDRYRAPARARMTARLAANGAILGWGARIAAPSTGADMARRLMPGAMTEAALALGGAGDAYAVAGAVPPYGLPALSVHHHPAEIGIATGHLRGGAHGYTAFFTECFLDELAHRAGSEPVSFRIGMLGGNPRLAKCLSTAAALGGWDGGVAGSGQGIAAHSFRGSHVAVLAEAEMQAGRPVVGRLVAAVDCGRVVNPELVRQQVEGGLIFGLAHALGASTGFTRGLADVRGFDRLALPRLADTPDVTVEIVASDEPPGGVSELAVPAVAPAIANALFSATGTRIRRLPFEVAA